MFDGIALFLQGDVQYVEDLEESDDDMEDLGARWAASSSESEGGSSSGGDDGSSDEDDDAAPPPAGQRHKRQRGGERGGGGAAAKRGRGVEWEVETERELAPAARGTA